MKTALIPAALAAACISTFAAATPVFAVDWYQEMLNASILSGEETWIRVGETTAYVAVNGEADEGVIDKGSYVILGNGSYVIDSGNIYDCSEQPQECIEALKNAAAENDSEEVTTEAGRAQLVAFLKSRGIIINVY